MPILIYTFCSVDRWAEFQTQIIATSAKWECIRSTLSTYQSIKFFSLYTYVRVDGKKVRKKSSEKTGSQNKWDVSLLLPLFCTDWVKVSCQKYKVTSCTYILVLLYGTVQYCFDFIALISFLCYYVCEYTTVPFHCVPLPHSCSSILFLYFCFCPVFVIVT